MDTSTQHTQRIIEQFSQQAVHFARLPGHAEATKLLLDVAGVTVIAEVLDIACGAGAVARPAASIAKHVTGIDLTPDMIEQAKLLQAEQGLSNLTWHVGDVTRLPFAPNIFDVVLTRYSFHHFLHPAGVLAEMVRVCKPGGRVAVADLALPADKIVAYDRMEKLRDPSHVRVLTESELQGLFQAIDLRNIQRAGYLFELGLEQLLAASFPKSDDANRIRAIFEADVGVDNLGIGVHHSGDDISFAYPIVILVATKLAVTRGTAAGSD
jgi:ubiquinone/menaquinone biosynthesis C-methylase UbiE